MQENVFFVNMKTVKNPFVTVKHRLQSQINKLRVLEIVTDGTPLEETEAQGISNILSNVITELEALENILDLQAANGNGHKVSMERVRGRKLAVVKSETESQPAA